MLLFNISTNRLVIIQCWLPATVKARVGNSGATAISNPSFGGSQFKLSQLAFWLWNLTMVKSSNGIRCVAQLEMVKSSSLIDTLCFPITKLCFYTIMPFQVTTTIHNLILGKLYCSHHGTMHIKGNRQYSCKLKFKEPSLLDRNPHLVSVNSNITAVNWDVEPTCFPLQHIALWPICGSLITFFCTVGIWIQRVCMITFTSVRWTEGKTHLCFLLGVWWKRITSAIVENTVSLQEFELLVWGLNMSCYSWHPFDFWLHLGEVGCSYVDHILSGVWLLYRSSNLQISICI